MLNGPALGIILAAAITYFAGVETVKGVKLLSHKVVQAAHFVAHKVRHPHEKTT